MTKIVTLLSLLSLVSPSVAQVPTILSFSPTSGSAGTAVTIAGTNFNTTANKNILYFGAVKAPVVSASSTQLTVTVPVGASYQPNTITDTSTGLTCYSNIPFVATFPSSGTINSTGFSPGADFPANSGSEQIAVCDIDGDGKPDLVAVNGSSNKMTVFRNMVYGPTSVPSTPTLASPANGLTAVSTNPILSWNTSTGASSYRLQVSIDSSFATLFYDQSNLTSTSQAVNGLANATVYYWRVNASNADGTSGWSSRWSFTTAAAGVPVITQVVFSGSVGSGLNISVKGSGFASASLSMPFTGVLPYFLFKDNTAGFSAGYTDLKSTVNTVTIKYVSWSDNDIETGGFAGLYGTIGGRVSAGDQVSITVWNKNSGNQTTWNGSLPVAPSSPTLASPSNGATQISYQPTTLIWRTSSGAASYRLQVSTDPNFGSTVFDSSSIADTSGALFSLSLGTTYYWRVNASNAAGTSGWTTAWSFTTVSTPQPPPVPILAGPANGATGTKTNPTLSWNASTAATSYELQVSTTSAFTTTSYDHSSLTSTSQAVSGLSNNTTYYWRVDAKNPSGTSAWSNVWSFTTVAGLPIPTLLSPSMSSNNIATNPTLSWSASLNGSTYELQVSTDSTFGAIFYDNKSIVDTSREITGLSHGTTYYWRVNASNPNTTSNWSPVWSFTTFTYPSSIQISKQYTPPSSMDQTNYRIIGLPGDIDIGLSNLLTGGHGTDWDAYWDNGDAQNYYEEYDGSGRFYFIPGQAFWVLSKKTFSVSQTASTVALDTSDCFSITVHSGWNLISNPFEKSVAWSAVQALNGVTQPIYSFNGSYGTSTSFDPYAGYYFYNGQNLSHLRIPYVYNTTGMSKKAEAHGKIASVQNNIVTLSLLSKKMQPLPVSIGFNPIVSDTLNNLNIFAPPDNFSNTGIQIIDPNVRGSWKKLYSDFRSEVGKGQSFDVEVKNLTGETVAVKSLVSDGFEGYDVYLVDNGTHTFYDLKTDDSISISGAYRSKGYSLLIGDGKYIDSIRSVYVPKSFQLYQNYPNPFNPATIIRYELPRQAHVTLNIYNVLGQLVEALVDQVQQAGYYETEFDGSKLASGVYFCRFSVGNYSQVRKIALIK